MTASLAIQLLRRVPFGPIALDAAQFDELRQVVGERIMISDDDYFVVKLSEYAEITVRRQG